MKIQNHTTSLYIKKKHKNHMNLSKFTIFLAITSICFSQDCSGDFLSQLQNKCTGLESCSFNDNECNRRGCNKAKNEESCKKTLPLEDNVLHSKKCSWDSYEKECKEDYKTCSDYNEFGGIFKYDGGDKCFELSTVSGKKCVLEADVQKGCVAHYEQCQNVIPTHCALGVVVSDFTKKCTLNTDTNPNTCVQESGKRTCTEAHNLYNLSYTSFRANDTICDKFEKDAGKNCVSFNAKCHEVWPNCKHYNNNPTECEYFEGYKRMPVNGNGIGFNYYKKCVWNNNHPDKCYEVDKECDDYNENLVGDDERCVNFKTTDDLKKCVFEEDELGNKKCYEKYKTCKDYSENTLNKDRKKCENSLLYVDTTEECEYILGKDQCQEKKKYSTCSEYNETGEKDRIICESIRSPTNNLYCVLESDNRCIEREPFCSEVLNEEDCIHIAKPSDVNKKCAFDGKKCYEEYIRCEDYLGNSTTNCSNIILYNGLQCEYDDNTEKCRTRNKFCSEARTKEECKLLSLSKTVVTDPDKKVCGDYYFTETINIPGVGTASITKWKCEEIFKYCSDYKGINKEDCENIKPYDETGEKIDTHSKCELESDTSKCQRVIKKCEEVGNNPILCSEISDKIKDNSTYYCRFDRVNDQCKTTYKTCDSYTETSVTQDSNKESICKGIIPKNYPTESCIYQKDDDNIYKCVQNKECIDFNSGNFEEFCNKVHPKCGYDSDSCQPIERDCEKIRFYIDSDENVDICKGAETSKPYKICTLKEDKSGCEEIYREFSFSTASSSYSEPPGSQSQESSVIIKGIHPILILLCLLF